MRAKPAKKINNFLDYGLNLVLVGVLTGIFAGTVVTFYNILAHLFEGYAVNLYALIRDNPAFVPLLFLGLGAGAIVIGTFVKLVPMIRGSGIPQIEGAARGVVRFKWYVTLCSMFAASLACMLMGLTAGAEGPSLEIGGCCGYGAGNLLKRNQMVKRLQTAAGASAGLAVAFNAPVTGMIFALEEAFRSFSPQVFISSAISVVAAIFTRNAFGQISGLHINTGFVFSAYVYHGSISSWGGETFAFCGFAVLAALVAALLGVAFYFLVFAAKNAFKKITFLREAGKYIIPFAVMGVFGLITAYSMGGGSTFIQALATGGTGEFANTFEVFGIGIVLSILIITVFKYVASVLAMGCGMPCGVFIPMLATGAGIGALLAIGFQNMGMNAAYTDYLIMITMAAFFTTIVKAPITGIVMVFELTGEFTNFLPALLGVAVGYVISEFFKLTPIYERCLAIYIEEEKLYEKIRKERVTVKVRARSRVDGAAIRSVIWPTNGLVVEITNTDGTKLVPDGEYILSAGVTLTFECETDNVPELMEYLYDLCGKP